MNKIFAGILVCFCILIVNTRIVGQNCSLSCKVSVNVSLGADCTAIIVADDLITSATGCNDLSVELFNEIGQPISTSPMVTSNQIGTIVTAVITDAGTGNNCDVFLNIFDKTVPTLVCGDFIFTCSENDRTPSVGNSYIDNNEQTIIDDCQTFEFNTFGNTAILSDLNVGLDVFVAESSQFFAFLEDPDGTMVTLIEEATTLDFCDDQYLNIFFDDHSQATYTDLNNACVGTDTLKGFFNPFSPLAAFSEKVIAGTWKLTICNDANEPLIYNGAQLNFGVNQTIFPFPLPIGVTVNQINTNTFSLTNFDGCGPATLSFLDLENDENCASPFNRTITRNWIVEDIYGNTNSCEQTFSFERLGPDQVVLPDNLTPADGNALSCEDRTPDPGNAIVPSIGWNILSNGNPSPDPEYYPAPNSNIVKWFGTGRPEVGGCYDLDFIFTDVRVNECSGANISACFKINRTWTAIDPCDGSTFTHVQKIFVEDGEGPSISGIEDVTISTSGFNCLTDWTATIPTLADNCNDNSGLSYLILSNDGNVIYNGANNEYTIENIPVGEHDITYQASDCCGNTTNESIRLTVLDQIPPTAVCRSFLTTNLGSNGTSKLNASVFNNGSNDDCTPVFFKVIRMDNTMDVLEGSTVSQPDTPCNLANGDDDTGKPGLQIYFDDEVYFCCDDIDNNPFVILRVFDVNPGLGPILPNRMRIGGDLFNRFNDCMTQVEVADKLPPQIFCPADITVECDIWVLDTFVTGVATATDNCELVNLTYSDNNQLNQCNVGTITRTWTATDHNGLTTSCNQLITFQDTTAPVITYPSERTIDCSDLDNLAIAGEPEVIDNCALIGFNYNDQIFPINGGCKLKVIRTWSGMDLCDWVAYSGQQIIIAEDNLPPMLIGVPDDLDADCNNIPPVPNVTAIDDCNNFSNLVFEENIINQQCEHTYQVERIWTATDVCGNQVSDSYIITIQDTLAPVFDSIPMDMNLQCFDQAPLIPLTATDNCDPMPDIQFSESTVPGNCPNRFTLVRSWTVTDACGNATMTTQNLIFSDDAAPVLSNVPTDLTLECGDAIPSAPTVTALDNCDGNITVQFSEVPGPNSCNDGLLFTRTWTATDACNNTTSDSQQIFLFDTDPPVFDSLPVDLTISCDDNFPDNKLTATDACTQNVIVSFNRGIALGSCPQELLVTWTWTAEDDCGNEAMHSILISVVDDNDPEIIGVPDDVTVSCELIPIAPTLSSRDDCDPNPSLTFSQQSIPGNCPQEMQLIRTWIAEDACGNSVSEVQNIFVTDEVAPVFMNIPIDVTVECDMIPNAAAVTSMDNCDPNPMLDFEQTRLDGNCLDNYTLRRIWRTEDACGNRDSIEQMITVQDTSVPSITGGPILLTVNCDNIPAPVNPTATDNCDQSVTLSFNEIRIDSSCIDLYRLERTWTATDNCGNESFFIQNVIVQDTTRPTLIGVPADIAVECNAIPDTAVVTADDNCDTDVMLVFTENRADGNCVDRYTLTRTWTATDNCGNQRIGIQVIDVRSTQPPILTGIPADVEVECDAIPDPAMPTAMGICSPATMITLVETIEPGSCMNEFILLRTWTAVDVCGNESSGSQEVSVSDNTRPVFMNTPPDITVDCDMIPDTALVTAIDNCDATVEIIFDESSLGGNCTGEGGITRTWIAIDSCGNQATYTQEITFVDTIAPVLMDFPADLTLNCDEGDPTIPPTAMDNCDANVIVKLIEDRVDVCPGTYTITRTFSATDNCGNVVSADQEVMVIDDQAPTFDQQLMDLTLSCENFPSPPTVTITDNCDSNPTLDFDMVFAPLDCPDNIGIVFTWTATDHCNNSSQLIQVITLIDSTGPTYTNFPIDFTVNCSNDPAITPVVVNATDNCDQDVTVSFEQSTLDSICINKYKIQRVYSATDNCGNTTMDTLVITVSDNIPPMFPSINTDITVSCEDVPDASLIQATDNCIGPVTLDFMEETLDSVCVGNKTILRTWMATDGCGNMSTLNQRIELFDTTKPVLSFVEPVILLDCSDDITAIPFVQATDNCGDTNPIDFFTDRFDEECLHTYKIRRQWIVTDQCSNSSDQEQTLIISDSNAPQFDAAVLDMTVNCDEIPDGSEILFSDNCDPQPRLIINDVRIDGNCEYEYVLNRSITIRDTCGNQNITSQVLTVVDNIAPTFICPTDITMSITIADDPPIGDVVCSLFVDVPLPMFVDNCDATPVITNDYTAANSNIGAASGEYPIGTTTVTYTIMDDCGNTNTCTINITILDEVDPILTCTGKNETLDPVSMTATTFLDEIVLFATDCELASVCFVPSGAKQIDWDCDDAGKKFLIQVLAIDASGNEIGCFDSIAVFPPTPNTCPGLTSIAQGYIATENEIPVSKVKVFTDGASNPPALTDLSGGYQVDNLIEGNDYTFLPKSNNNIRDHLSTIDLVKMGRHIIGLEPLDSPYKLIAADVDYSNQIDVFDMVELQNLLLWRIDEFQNGDAWRFVDKAYQFPTDQNPFSKPFPEFIDQDNISTSATDLDFVAIKLGDLNNSYSQLTEDSPRSIWDWYLPEFSLLPNQQTIIPVYGSPQQRTEGLQFAWAFDQTKIEVTGLVAGQLDPVYNLLEGELLASAIEPRAKNFDRGTPLFKVVVKVKEKMESTELFNISEDKIAAYSVVDGEVANSIALNYEQLEQVYVQNDKELPILFSNRPNPFQDKTTLRFLLPEEGQTVVQIVDVAGRALYRQDLYMEAGYHEMVLLRDQLNSDGVLICQLITTKGTVSQKLLLLAR